MPAKPPPTPLTVRKLLRRISHGKGGGAFNLAGLRRGAAEIVGPFDESDGATEPELRFWFAAIAFFGSFAAALLKTPELRKASQRIAALEEQYMPGYPPMSPLTDSCFVQGYLFDMPASPEKLSVAECILMLSGPLHMHPELREILEVLSASRLGVYRVESVYGGEVGLREIATGQEQVTVLPRGHAPGTGELWLVRVLAPVRELGRGCVLMTPYVLNETTEDDWRAYFHRQIGGAPESGRDQALAAHMKSRSAPTYWFDYILDGYAGHNENAIFLAGLPDVPESLPHASSNDPAAESPGTTLASNLGVPSTTQRIAYDSEESQALAAALGFPARKMSETLLEWMRPELGELLGLSAPQDILHRLFELAVLIWNAEVLARHCDDVRGLADLERLLETFPAEGRETFRALSARKRSEYEADPRLVAHWDLRFMDDEMSFTCEVRLTR